MCAVCDRIFDHIASAPTRSTGQTEAGRVYEGQQALAANLLHLGMSHAGLIAWEDMRAAEFVASRPEVDAKRIAAMGLSMGSFRTWQVAALSDHIAAGVAICWLNTVKGLMVPGNNQTRGQSAFTLTHPGLFNYLDYEDVASLAFPKPMLFYNGEQDRSFRCLVSGRLAPNCTPVTGW